MQGAGWQPEVTGARKGISPPKGAALGLVKLVLVLVLVLVLGAALPFGLAFLSARLSPWLAAVVIAFFLLVSLTLFFLNFVGESKNQSRSNLILNILSPFVFFGSALAGGLIGSA